MAIDIDNIPRTIDLVRDDSNTSVIPDGYPVLSIIDQTQLPYAEAYLHLTDWREAIGAIKQLKVRGARDRDRGGGFSGACCCGVLRGQQRRFRLMR